MERAIKTQKWVTFSLVSVGICAIRSYPKQSGNHIYKWTKVHTVGVDIYGKVRLLPGGTKTRQKVWKWPNGDYLKKISKPNQIFLF